MIRYELPMRWIRYSFEGIAPELLDAKAAVETLRSLPYQRSWVEDLQEMELKREIAGTSKIEGADFTEREFEEAMSESVEELLTRSQRQAWAAKGAYKWIASVPDDRPIDGEVILEIHRRIVTGADDDHCPPGKLRTKEENVNFGQPRHRGAEGGMECEQAFASLAEALGREYGGHDPVIQAMAAHYHIAAMHPFLDGNGRTARALEALLLQRAGLRDSCFIAMSNYYYDEKIAYLKALAETRAARHDLTPFLRFALKGLAIQSRRLIREIRPRIQKALYRDVMHDLFGRLVTKRKRVLGERQLALLDMLLDQDGCSGLELARFISARYRDLKNPAKAIARDLTALERLGAIRGGQRGQEAAFLPNLDWPTQITETEFYERMKALPKAKLRQLR